MPHLSDDGFIVDDYQEWLKMTGAEDAPETKGWYDCPEGKQSDYIKDHPDWWKNF